MGLLDGNYTPDPLAQGLLGLGSALLTPRQLGGGLMAGANAFTQGATQAAMLRRQMAQDAMRQRYLEAQIEETKALSDARRASAAERETERARVLAQQQGQRDVLSGIIGRNQPGFRDASIAIGGKAPAGYTPPMGQVQISEADMAAWIGQGGDPAALRAIAEARNLGRSKVAREVTIAGPDGSPVKVLLDDFGNRIGGEMPEAVKLEMVNTGNAVTPVNSFTQKGALPISMSAAERDASARGWAGVQTSRDRLAFDKSQADKPSGDKWVTDLQGGRQVNERTGEARPITMDGKPVGMRNDDAPKREQNAKDALKIIEQAEGLLDRSTSGYFGTGVDKAAQVLGMAPQGAIAGAQLKTLQGALMMRMPRMEGPQSNLDVQLYRESVGQIGDTTVPVAARKAALAEVRRLQEKYAGIEPSNTVDFKNVGRQSGGGVVNFGDLK